MTIKDILNVYYGSSDMLIRIYRTTDCGMEEKIKPAFCEYVWKLPQVLNLGDYEALMDMRVVAVRANYNVALHFYVSTDAYYLAKSMNKEEN